MFVYFNALATNLLHFCSILNIIFGLSATLLINTVRGETGNIRENRRLDWKATQTKKLKHFLKWSAWLIYYTG